MERVTIEEALKRASFCLRQAGLQNPRAEAEIIMAWQLNSDRLQVFLKRSNELSQELETAFREAIRRRCRGEPTAYITGYKYFFSRRFLVNKSVLIPRPETELLCEAALNGVRRLKKSGKEAFRCLDLGTGSGILAVTLALHLPEAEIWAVDLSAEALELARANAFLHGLGFKVRWLRGDYFEALSGIEPQPRFNLVLSNPPYLSRADLEMLSAGVSDYEPLEALFGGEDGLDSYRAILEGIGPFIKKPALVMLEVGAGQKQSVEDLCRGTGLFQDINWHTDLNGWPRVFEGVVN